MRGPGDHYGCHRVISPSNAFPQAAERLDASLPIFDNEILIRVDRLNLDSSSFRQLWEASGENQEIMKRQVLHIIQKRGKMHNPVTNSGGTLLGTIEESGKNVQGKGFSKGERVVTLVSLSLTPLHMDAIRAMDVDREQIQVEGHAILFESGIVHRLPPDFSESLALAVFDVCGAPALAKKYMKPGNHVVILGAGKAGVLAASQARLSVGPKGKVTILEKNEEAARHARKLSFVDEVIVTDLRWGLSGESGISPDQSEHLASPVRAKAADLVINCVNAQGTEMASILAAKKSGTVLFFNMAINFQAAVLGAEGIGHETRLLMGNGYTPGHADMALGLVREFRELREWFERRFALHEAAR